MCTIANLRVYYSFMLVLYVRCTFQVEDSEMALEGDDSEDDDDEEDSEDETDTGHEKSAPEAAEPADDPMDLREDAASTAGPIDDTDEKVYLNILY